MKKSFWILILILVFSFVLRVFSISSSPPSLYGDELTITLDAYSLAKEGKDQLGNILPLTFQMGAGRPAGYVYGTVPFVALFGPTELGVRALSVLSGLGIILLLYLICKELFSKRIGLITAFIAGVSIWEISLSRGGFEAHFALFLALLGIYLFITASPKPRTFSAGDESEARFQDSADMFDEAVESLKVGKPQTFSPRKLIKAKEKPVFYILSALSFGLTLHTYPTYKVSLLLFLPLLFWYQGRVILGKKFFLSGVVVFILIGLTVLSQTFMGGSETRFAGINIFSQLQLKEKIEQKIILERQTTTLPFVLAQYFHNRPVEYAKVFLENYLQNFSLDFLVIHGDRAPRHNMATMGQLYFAQIILIFIAIFALWFKQKRHLVFLGLWTFLAPIPTAVVDLPHALRSSFMLPPLLILSAIGFSILWENKRRIILNLLILIFVIQFVFFIQKLFFLSPAAYSGFWAYSAKLASEIAIQNKDKYDYIILSDKIDSVEYAYPVYAKEEPKNIIMQNEQKATLGSFSFKNFNNVYIGQIPDSEVQGFIQKLDGSVLYVDTLDGLNYLKNYEIINGLGNFKALVIVKKKI